MTYRHLRDLIVKYRGDKRYVLDRILTERLEIRGKWFVKDWPDPYFPTYAPSTYVELMDRLDGQEFEFDGRSCITENRIEASGRIYTSLIFKDGTSINFQSLKEDKRWSVTSGGRALNGYDVSASQLRVALALRGKTLPIHESPWDELTPKVEHDELRRLPLTIRRKVVKGFALMMVKNIRNFNIKGKWDEIVNKPPHRNLIGLKKAIQEALEASYPALGIPLPVVVETPDGYGISKIENEWWLPVKCRPLRIDTRYKIPVYGKPDTNNVVEAMEGWVLREVLKNIPAEVPVLTCHDEVVTLPEHEIELIAAWDKTFQELAKSHQS
jgi:hypothetical protein